MTTPLPGGVLCRASFTYDWCYSVETPSRSSLAVHPCVFVGKDGKPVAVSDASGLYVVEGRDLVKAHDVQCNWSEATISYRLDA